MIILQVQENATQHFQTHSAILLGFFSTKEDIFLNQNSFINFLYVTLYLSFKVSVCPVFSCTEV